jgi:tetratricopeptide (TPR) repeat protein
VVIREYAAEKAIDSGSLDATEARYSAFTLERGRTLAREAEGPGGREALARLALEAENLAFVHERAMAAEPPAAEAALDAALALEPLIARRGPVARLLSLLDAALGAGGGLDAALGAGGGVDAARIARARRARADAKRILGRTPESIADCEAALAAAVQTRDVGLLARVEIATGRTLLELERFAEARRHMERALTLSREAGDRAQVGSAWMNLGNICLWEGRGREAREAFESCLVAAREGDDPQGAGMAEASLGNLDLEIGHLAAARKHFARALRLFGRRGDRQAEGLLGVLLASLDFEEGRLDDARERLAESLRLLRDVGHRRGESFALCLLGECDWVEGRPDRARERFEHALRIQRERGHRRHEVMTLAHLACLEAEEGNLDVAERAVTTAEARVAEAPSPAFEAAAWVSRGQLELALARTAGADEAERRRGIARALAAKARARPEGVSGAGHSTELRFLLARLEKRLEEAEVDSLVVRSDGGRFRPPRGKWVDLTRRRVLQRLLRHLAGRRLEAPGAPTDLDGMVEVGWPGERMRPDAAATRVYGAVSTLRKLGLASVLESREDGYLLNPRVPLVVAP